MLPWPQVEKFYIDNGYLFPKYHIFYWMALTTPTAEPQVSCCCCQSVGGGGIWPGDAHDVQSCKVAAVPVHVACGSMR